MMIGGCGFYPPDEHGRVVLPSNITSLPQQAYYGCKRLKSIYIPSSVESIGAKAFGDCSSLISVDIPSSVEVIGSEAFQNCHALANASYYYKTVLQGRVFDDTGYPVIGGTRVIMIGATKYYSL